MPVIYNTIYLMAKKRRTKKQKKWRQKLSEKPVKLEEADQQERRLVKQDLLKTAMVAMLLLGLLLILTWRLS